MFPPPQIENWHSAFAKNVLNCVQISPCASCFEFGQKKSGECDLNPINCPNTGGNLWEPITKQFLTGLPVKHLRPRSTSVLFSLKILSSECQIFVKKSHLTWQKATSTLSGNIFHFTSSIGSWKHSLKSNLKWPWQEIHKRDIDEKSAQFGFVGNCLCDQQSVIKNRNCDQKISSGRH